MGGAIHWPETITIHLTAGDYCSTRPTPTWASKNKTPLEVAVGEFLGGGPHTGYRWTVHATRNRVCIRIPPHRGRCGYDAYYAIDKPGQLWQEYYRVFQGRRVPSATVTLVLLWPTPEPKLGEGVKE
jgi:hypothetical protein